MHGVGSLKVAMQPGPIMCGGQGDWQSSARARLRNVDPELYRPGARLTRAKDVYDASASETLGSPLAN